MYHKSIRIKHISQITPTYNYVLAATSIMNVKGQLLSQHINYTPKLWGILGTNEYRFPSPNKSLKSLLSDNALSTSVIPNKTVFPLPTFLHKRLNIVLQSDDIGSKAALPPKESQIRKIAGFTCVNGSRPGIFLSLPWTTFTNYMYLPLFYFTWNCLTY